jgi:hypothetical protein
MGARLTESTTVWVRRCTAFRRVSPGSLVGVRVAEHDDADRAARSCPGCGALAWEWIEVHAP